MSWLLAAIYDLGMREVERHGLAAWRAELLAHVEGDVLEIGAGTGANLPHYPAAIRRLVLAEPDPHMRHKLAQRTSKTDREIMDNSAEALALPEASFDAVVSTLVTSRRTRWSQPLRAHRVVGARAARGVVG